MTLDKPICFSCKHFNIEELNCDAFKKEIPMEILGGDNDHSKPLPDQENNIVFEKKEEAAA